MKRAPIRRTITLERPNPCGRRALTYAYSRLLHWSDLDVQRVEGLALYYFRHIGGFRVVSDAVARVMLDAWERAAADPDLQRLGIDARDALRWAIDAKAASLHPADPADPRERAVKNRMRGTPASFFGDKLDYWLDQHPRYQDVVARAAPPPPKALGVEDVFRRRLAAHRQRIEQTPPEFVSHKGRLVPLADFTGLARDMLLRRVAFEAFCEECDRNMGRSARLIERLTPQQRQVLGADLAAFATFARVHGFDQADHQLDGLRDAWKLTAAQLRWPTFAEVRR